jgi:hypothetical protein
MTKLALVLPEVGSKNIIADPRIPTALQSIQAVVNGELEGTNNFKAEGIVEANLAKALQEKIGAKVSGLIFTRKAESFVGESGFLYYMETGKTTLTLPLPSTKDRVVGVIAGSDEIKIKTPAGSIYGDFITGQATITLKTYQHVVLHSSGEGFAEGWWIESGEPLREQKYGAFTARTINTEYEPSFNRPTLVNAYGGVTKGKEFIFKPTVGGVALGGVNMNLESGELGIIFLPLTFICQAGQKWKAEVTGTSPVLYSQYVTL